jgi:hypothetical protein
MNIEYALKYAPAYLFIGKKPTAVLFGDERVTVKKWTDVYRLVYGRVNHDQQAHEDLMCLRNKVAGRVRTFISDSPTGMTRPMKVDEGLYIETHYGTETMHHIMVDLILSYVRYDISDIKVVVKI